MKIQRIAAGKTQRKVTLPAKGYRQRNRVTFCAVRLLRLRDCVRAWGAEEGIAGLRSGKHMLPTVGRST
jgi:hypothetical protein